MYSLRIQLKGMELSPMWGLRGLEPRNSSSKPRFLNKSLTFFYSIYSSGSGCRPFPLLATAPALKYFLSAVIVVHASVKWLNIN